MSERSEHRRLLFERDLPESTERLVSLIDDAMREPHEHVPSRIRHAARDTQAVLDAIALVERCNGKPLVHEVITGGIQVDPDIDVVDQENPF